jgi:hypothetical protein
MQELLPSDTFVDPFWLQLILVGLVAIAALLAAGKLGRMARRRRAEAAGDEAAPLAEVPLPPTATILPLTPETWPELRRPGRESASAGGPPRAEGNVVPHPSASAGNVVWAKLRRPAQSADAPRPSGFAEPPAAREREAARPAVSAVSNPSFGDLLTRKRAQLAAQGKTDANRAG